MALLDYLFHGTLTVHQDLINRSLKEALSEIETIKEMHLSIAGGKIKFTALFAAGKEPKSDIRLTINALPGNFEFNRHHRYLELLLAEPVLIEFGGAKIRARFTAEAQTGGRDINDGENFLTGVLRYLDIKEDRITVDFNRLPGFNEALQKKLGFLLKYLEIAGIELEDEKIVIRPAVKLF